MVEFALLFLGLVAGEQPIEVRVGEGVAVVEILLDGEKLATLRGAPWAAVCDLGQVPRPRELVAVARDGDGEEIGRAAQWLNVPRRRAEVRWALEAPVEPGGRPLARLVWLSVEHEQPREVRAWLDGRPLAVGDPERIELPPLDPESLHFLQAELVFDDEMEARAELAFGGILGDDLNVDLTAVVVTGGRGRLPAAGDMAGWFLARGEPLRVVAVERGPAEVLLVRERSEEVWDGIERLTHHLALQKRRSTGLMMARGIAPGDRVRLAFPAVERSERPALQMERIPVSADLAGQGDGSLFAVVTSDPFPRLETPAEAQRLADAVAIAGLEAAGTNRRRAVVLLAGGAGRDTSRFTPGEVRSLLADLQVPLYVWSPQRDALEGWGEAVRVASLGEVGGALRDLQRDLESQAVVWLEGRYLPGRVELSRAARGIELVPPESIDPRQDEPAGVEGEPAGARVGTYEPSPIFGRPAGWALADPAAGTYIPVVEGTLLRAEASPSAAVVAVLPDGEVEVLDWHGRWAEVAAAGERGWVDLEDPLGGRQLASPARAAGVAAPSGPDPRHLALAREHLGAAARDARAGPFTLYTDVEEMRLPTLLDRIAAQVEALYTARYGLQVAVDRRPEAVPQDGEPAPEVVVLFEREEDYRGFEAALLGLHGRGAAELAGHAAPGLAVLYSGGRSTSEVAVTLVHEVAHLLTRRAFSDPPLPWLDEGLAEDLALSPVDARGRFGPATIDRGTMRRGGRMLELFGPWVRLPALVAEVAPESLPTLAQLAALDREAFLTAPDRWRHYALAGFWVRYLLEGDDEEQTRRFRAFLAAAAAGGGTGPAALAEALGPTERLEAGFRRWLHLLPARLGLPAGG